MLAERDLSQKFGVTTIVLSRPQGGDDRDLLEYWLHLVRQRIFHTHPIKLKPKPLKKLLLVHIYNGDRGADMLEQLSPKDLHKIIYSVETREEAKALIKKKVK